MDQRTSTILRWYRTHKRNLPWRRTQNPYRIFISELMLQQTQVERVIPKYHAFLKRFPHWNALATATTAELIRAWTGLGYNRRALYAREAARTVVHTGIPSSEHEWRKLKGVGPYMAAALTEFVNHIRSLVMDTNVRRVVGRLMLGKPFPGLEDDKRIFAALKKLTPQTAQHAELPHAFMDFGSAVCTSRAPLCLSCPLRTQCKAAKTFLAARGKTLRRTPAKITERIHRDKSYPDRIYRGRILSRVQTHGPLSLQACGPRIDPNFDPIADSQWLRDMAERLVKDGLLRWKSKDILALPLD